ncbi:heparinase II/III domain-containing protein [Helicobacter pullorum]|uniref:heparinase II/III domain-containing protein n=1 Tax=Helicobacter pullorum TaxID=35818 RepID=UPI00242E24B0|nr:heparinase II/III family protein [Helicobacter pullorum]
MFLDYGGRQIKIDFPINWAKNPFKISAYPHHLMSLRWINESFSKEQIRTIILDFYNFHFVKKVSHSYYVQMCADHCTCIRLFKMYRIRSLFDDDSEILNIISCIIARDLKFLQNDKIYRVGHNHGIMADTTLFFFYNNGFRDHISLMPILHRSYITFNAMWSSFGETREHSVTYQEFNLEQTLAYLRELDILFNRNKNESCDLFVNSTNKTSELLKETTKIFLGFMLTSKKLYFPIGDTVRKPSVGSLSKIFFPSRKTMDISEILYPYSVMNGSYSSESYFMYRERSFGRYIHFVCTCNWNSDAHKQNDELHFCLQIDDDIIFDDCGYTDFLSKEQYGELASEFSHSGITINNHNYTPKEKSNNKSKILNAEANLFGFKVAMQHNRIENCCINREIVFNNKLCFFEINDEVISEDSLIGEQINFRFVLSPHISVLRLKNKGVLLSTKNNIKYMLTLDAIFNIEVRKIIYAGEDYPNLSFTNVIILSCKIHDRKNRYSFKFEKYTYKGENMQFDHFVDLKNAICNSNIKYYVIKPYNTGFTDTFLGACVASSLLDSLGLIFKGIIGIDEINRSEYYQDLYKKINFKNTYNGNYYSIVDNDLNIDNIINEVKNIDKSVDTILLKFNYNHVLRLFELFPNFENKFFFSSFYGYFSNSTRTKIIYDNKINITIHLRLGDEYPLFVNKDVIVNPGMILRSRFDYAYYNVRTKKGYRVIQQRLNSFDKVEFYIKKIRETYKDSIKINFISDGMDLGMDIMNSEDVKNKLKKLQIDIDDEFLKISAEQSILKLKSLEKYCDEVIVGENTDKFMQTKNILLKSDIIVSSARLFCWGILSAFKYDLTFRQVLFMNNSGSYYETINNKNIKIEQYKSFDYCIDNICRYIKELGYESNVLKELELNNQELTQTKNQLDSTKKQLDSKTKELESKNKILSSNPNPSHLIQNTSCFKGKLAYLNTLATAKDRIHNHLSYKLGQAMIENSKSLLGYIRMPYVLSYIKDKHKQEQQQYQEAIKKNPNLKLPNLESYPDYQESLKEKECLTYKLGEAFIKASKTWYKGGYVKLWFEVRKLKREFRKKELK